MAATLRPQVALDVAKIYISNMPVNATLPTVGDTVAGWIAQYAHEAIWAAAPWRWTLGAITPITLAAGSQEFTMTLPGDFLKFDRCFISNGVTMRPVKATALTQPTATLTQYPDFVSFIPGGTNKIRFDSVFGPVNSGETWTFFGWYKKVAPSIFASLNSGGILVMDDDYFWVFQEWVLYWTFKYGYDGRAGGAEVKVDPQGNKQIAYTGQYAIAQAALETLKTIENLQFAFPEVNPNPDKTR